MRTVTLIETHSDIAPLNEIAVDRNIFSSINIYTPSGIGDSISDYANIFAFTERYSVLSPGPLKIIKNIILNQYLI